MSDARSGRGQIPDYSPSNAAMGDAETLATSNREALHAIRSLNEGVLPDGLEPKHRPRAYATVVIGLSLAALDGSIINLALPTLSAQFGVSAASTIWLVNAYQLVMVIALLPLASLGEIYGYRRIYMTGLILFAVASGLCAFSSTLLMLVAARTLQGVAAACIMSVNTAIVRYIFPSKSLGRAIGGNAIIVATAGTLGPGIASVILSFASWPWIFAINIPICLAGVVIGWRRLPQSHRVIRQFDLRSTIQLAATFGLVIGGLSAMAHSSGAVLSSSLFVAGIASLIWMIRSQTRLETPMLPMDLLALPIFRLSLCASAATFCAQLLALVALPFHLQRHLGFDVASSGLLLMAWPIAVGLTAPLAGRLADRVHAGILGAVGLACMSAGIILLALTHDPTSKMDFAWRLALCGFGFGLFQSPNNRTIILSAPLERSGSAGGMLGTARLTGQAFGAAFAALLLGRFGQEGPYAALLLAAGLAAAGAVLSVRRARKFRPF